MNWRITLAALGVLGLVVGLTIVDAYHIGVFHDDAMYVILARAIATGQGYRWINLPDAPFASHYPPGYPAVLALLWKISPRFPENVALFKAFNAVCLAGCTVLVAQLAKERLGSARWASAVGILTAIGVPFLVLSTMVLSEPLFLLLGLAALLLSERLLGDDDPRRALLVGVLIGAAMLVRTHGLVLALALILLLFARKKLRSALIVIGGVVLIVAPWQLWAASHADTLPAALAGTYGSYTGWWLDGFRSLGFAMIPATITRTVLESLAMLVTLFSPGRAQPVNVVTLVAIIGAIIAGGVALSRRAPVTALFLAGYFMIVFVWPFPPSRFFWGVWPLLILLLLAGAFAAAAGTGWPKALRISASFCFLWLAVGYTMYEVRAVRGRWWSSIARSASPRIESAVRYATAHSDSADIISADDEGAIYLYSGRRTVPASSFTTAHYLSDRPAAREAAEGLSPILARYPARVVIVGGRRSFEAAQYLASGDNPLLAPLEAFEGGAAYAVRKR
jgi:hypothetical protein